MRKPILLSLALILLFSVWSDLALSGNIALNPATKDRVFMTVDGQPFFPVGIYFRMWPEPFYLDTLLESGLNLALTPGFDLMDTTLSDAYTNILNQLSERGIKLISYPAHVHHASRVLYKYDCEGDGVYLNFDLFEGDFNRMLDLVSRSEHPENVIGWCLFDEPDGHCFDCDATSPGGHGLCNSHKPSDPFDYCYEPALVDSFYKLIKALDPMRRFSCNCIANNCPLTDVTEFGRFAGSTDLILNDEYEFRNCAWHDYYWKLGLQAMKCAELESTRDKPFIAVMTGAGPCSLKCYGPKPSFREICTVPQYTKYPPRLLSRDTTVYIMYWPEYRDIRHNVYSSILGGARGIIFWIDHRSCCLVPDTSCWEFYSAIAREILVGNSSQNVPPIKDLVLRQGWYWTTWVTSSHDGIDMCWCDADSCPRRPPGASPSNGMDDVNYLAVMQWYPGETIRYFLIVVNDCGSRKKNVLFHFDEPSWSFGSSEQPESPPYLPPYQSPWFNAHVRLIPPFYHPWEQSGKQVGFNNDNVWMDLDPWEVCGLEVYRCLEGRPCGAGVPIEKPKGEGAILLVEQHLGVRTASIVFGIPDSNGELLKLEIIDVLG